MTGARRSWIGWERLRAFSPIARERLYGERVNVFEERDS